MWPSAFPDLNSINVLMWSMLKGKVSSVSHPSVDVLKTCRRENGLKYIRKQCMSMLVT